jgi:hypothetical protein
MACPLYLCGEISKMKSFLSRSVCCICLAGLILIGWGSIYWRVDPWNFAQLAIKAGGTQIIGFLSQNDLHKAGLLRERYFQGGSDKFSLPPETSWRNVEAGIPGFRYLADSKNAQIDHGIPFVYEESNAPYLARFRAEFRLQDMIAGSADEFAAMMAVAHWVGTRWDHGLGALPESGKYDPGAIVAKAEQGTPYWCEISSILMIQAAASLGWPARLVTASRDGYRWEHALAEIWSNQYGKWFVVDADFNIIYWADEKPLSAYELCHRGPLLQKNGKLQVKQFAPLKPSLELKDLLPYYRYVHIDLRNDWFSRKLRKGSPAGGDLATWWTARSDLGPLLTVKIRVDDQKKFDWAVNAVGIYADGVSRDPQSGEYRIGLTLAGYSPYFKNFQFARESGKWEDMKSSSIHIPVTEGTHCIEARAMTLASMPGPASTVCYYYAREE